MIQSCQANNAASMRDSVSVVVSGQRKRYEISGFKY